MQDRHFDSVILGGGSAGYTFAFQRAQKGERVALVDNDKLGGVCLHRGCIPSKAWIAAAARHQGTVSDALLKKWHLHKEKVIATLHGGLQNTSAAHGIIHLHGSAAFMSSGAIAVEGHGTITGTTIVIATGSRPRTLPHLPCDHRLILDSTSVLEQTTKPASIAIVGAGAIGCEFASFFQSVGTKVMLIDVAPRLLPAECCDLAQSLRTNFEQRGIECHTATQINKVEKGANQVTLHLESDVHTVERVLVAVGRTFNTDTLALHNTPVRLDPRGAICVDQQLRAAQNIYAIGDVNGKALFAHAASHQALFLSNFLSHPVGAWREHAIPSVTYTTPEIASVGLSFEKAQNMERDAMEKTIPLQAIGKAHAIGQTEGWARIVFHATTKTVLGAQVFGYQANLLIAPMVLAVHHQLTLDDLVATPWAHPTLSEVWLEVACAALQQPLHGTA